MRIESLAGTPDRAGRFRAVLEDGTVLRLYRQTVEDFGLVPGAELTAEELEKLKLAAGQTSAKMRAVRIVAASSVSKDDLQRRLIQKGEDPDQARQAVAWLEEMELVDDRQTAAQIAGRCAARGYGLQRAKQALYEKRIPKAYWQEALASYPDQTEFILAFLRQRMDGDWNEREQKRAVDALLRRGHSYSDIRRCLEALGVEE